MFATVAPPPQRLLVFARVPELGKVKTRIAAAIGDEGALAVYKALLADTLRAIGPSDARTEIEILWAPTVLANGEILRQAFGDRSLAMQTGASLGDRMAMAFSERFFFQQTQKIIAIGVDEPRLARQTIDHAFALLDSCEWVVGPAGDGGYYLIGCRAPAFDSAIFQDIAWGTGEVSAATLTKIRQWGSTVALLPSGRDIDTVEDLNAHAAAMDGEQTALAEWLRKWKEEKEQR